jgi:hypothetical protein
MKEETKYTMEFIDTDGDECMGIYDTEEKAMQEGTTTGASTFDVCKITRTKTTYKKRNEYFKEK